MVAGNVLTAVERTAEPELMYRRGNMPAISEIELEILVQKRFKANL